MRQTEVMPQIHLRASNEETIINAILSSGNSLVALAQVVWGNWRTTPPQWGNHCAKLLILCLGIFRSQLVEHDLNFLIKSEAHSMGARASRKAKSKKIVMENEKLLISQLFRATSLWRPGDRVRQSRDMNFANDMLSIWAAPVSWMMRHSPFDIER